MAKLQMVLLSALVVYVHGSPVAAMEGVSGSAAYKADHVSTDRGARTLGNFDLKVDLDTGVLLGFDGGKFHFYGLGNHGGDPTNLVGDIQGTSNIETSADTFRLYEAYYSQDFASGVVSVLAGLYDLNSEFYAVRSQGLFLNSNFGVGKELSQTGVNGPSIFPVTASAARLRAFIPEVFYAQLAVFNAQAGDPANPYGTHVRLAPGDGTLTVFEGGWATAETEPAAKAGLGCWGYSKAAPTTKDPSVEKANRGCFVILEKTFDGGVGAFAKYGVAEPSVNKYSSSFAGGVVWNGFGLGVAGVSLAADERDARTTGGGSPSAGETTYELTYQWRATTWLNVQPNLQRVQSPGADARATDVTVTGVRGEAHFEF